MVTSKCHWAGWGSGSRAGTVETHSSGTAPCCPLPAEGSCSNLAVYLVPISYLTVRADQRGALGTQSQAEPASVIPRGFSAGVCMRGEGGGDFRAVLRGRRGACRVSGEGQKSKTSEPVH